MIANIVIVAAVVVALVLIVRKQVKTGGSCGCGCGDGACSAPKKVKVTDTDESHYPYSTDIKVAGMVCDGCVENVQNALNAIDGTYAKVDLKTQTAHVMRKQPIDLDACAAAIRNAGYQVKYA